MTDEERLEKRRAYQKKYYAEHAEEQRAYMQQYRDEHKEARLESHKKYRVKYKANKERVLDYLIQKYSDTPCMDCGGVFPWCVMDFDHRPENVKEFKIASIGMAKATLNTIVRLEKEVSKCDLVCSNCHRIRTNITRKKDA